jgi:hypothetical protein
MSIVNKILKEAVSKSDLAETIKTNLDLFFKPDRSGFADKREAVIEGDRVVISFRDLGNWQGDPEEEFDEDDDHEIWCPGEYDKYLKYFQAWVANEPWAPYVTIQLSTGEKNYCYFIINLK